MNIKGQFNVVDKIEAKKQIWYGFLFLAIMTYLAITYQINT